MANCFNNSRAWTHSKKELELESTIFFLVLSLVRTDGLSKRQHCCLIVLMRNTSCIYHLVKWHSGTKQNKTLKISSFIDSIKNAQEMKLEHRHNVNKSACRVHPVSVHLAFELWPIKDLPQWPTLPMITSSTTGGSVNSWWGGKLCATQVFLHDVGGKSPLSPRSPPSSPAR